MTPLPKRRHSTRRQGTRRAAIRLVLPHVVACKHCGQPKKSHTLCTNCNR